MAASGHIGAVETTETEVSSRLDDATIDNRPGFGSGVGAERLLRLVLLVNAASSFSTGLFGLVFAGTAGDLIGVDQHWLIRVVGAGLIVFSASVVAIGRSGVRSLVAGAAVISINDFVWVVATAVVAGLGWLSTSGVVIMGIVAVMVGTFGLLQLLARRALTGRR